MRSARQDPRGVNAERGADFSTMLLFAFRDPRWSHDSILAPMKPFTLRERETKEAISKRLEFFVSLPRGRGHRDGAIEETAQHFNVGRRTIERDLATAKKTLEKARQGGLFPKAEASWALEVLAGREDRTFNQLLSMSM